MNKLKTHTSHQTDKSGFHRTFYRSIIMAYEDIITIEPRKLLYANWL